MGNNNFEQKKNLIAFVIFIFSFFFLFFLRHNSALLQVSFSDVKILSFLTCSEQGRRISLLTFKPTHHYKTSFPVCPGAAMLLTSASFFSTSPALLWDFLISSFDTLPAGFGYLKTWNSRTAYILNSKFFCRTCDDISAAQAPLM